MREASSPNEQMLSRVSIVVVFYRRYIIVLEFQIIAEPLEPSVGRNRANERSSRTGLDAGEFDENVVVVTE